MDLGFFRAIQSLQYKAAPRTKEELIEATINAYNAFDPRALANNFLSYDKCMEASMTASGGNQYQQPHMHKKRLRNERMIVDKVACERAIYNLGKNLVNEPQ